MPIAFSISAIVIEDSIVVWDNKGNYKLGNANDIEQF